MVRNEVYPELLFNENDKFERVIKTINKRFTTYGYKRIRRLRSNNMIYIPR